MEKGTINEDELDEVLGYFRARGACDSCLANLRRQHKHDNETFNTDNLCYDCQTVIMEVM